MFYSGIQGELYIEGQKAAKVRNWSMNTSLSLLDTTTLGDTDTTTVPGIRTNTGSCQIYYYNPTMVVGDNNSASELINKLIKAGTDGVAPEAEEVVLKLSLTNETGTPTHVECPVYLTSVSMSCAVGEVVSADVAFQVNGAFTRVVL